MQLDAVDLRILAELQQDGSLTNVDWPDASICRPRLA
jgi:DNA-binding Lrp family transcriptional regulator